MAHEHSGKEAIMRRGLLHDHGSGLYGYRGRSHDDRRRGLRKNLGRLPVTSSKANSYGENYECSTHEGAAPVTSVENHSDLSGIGGFLAAG
ncbi:hypothetical protein [Ralstonia solanacearum]|uniref:hypothetical protein n=1 Tax=Ralstonia solanacearum TaxID=305 RepID=UPI000ABDB64A|nr:hypothetical protein [Ralstonia solanacearum]